LDHSFVSNIVERQQQVGIQDPILNYTCSLLAAVKYNSIEADVEEEDSAEGCSKNGNICSCMCCYYWVSRRKKQRLVPLPMQNLLWFVRTLTGCEAKKCDSRILLRLVKTIIIPGNTYAIFFEKCELQGMGAIAEIHDQEMSVKCMQGDTVFCVKQHIARLWFANNGKSIMLPHRQATDLLRQC
jgi:hypothetical protein